MTTAGDSPRLGPPAPDPAFWLQVARATARTLALDYDGTLVPFQTDRMAARLSPALQKFLANLAGQHTTDLAIVSGRSLAELETLIGDLASRIFLVGAHGREARIPGGGRVSHPPAPDVDRILDQAREEAMAAVPKELGQAAARTQVERKLGSVALHLRGLDQELARAWLERTQAAWRRRAGPELELLPFSGGIELRARGWHKGLVIEVLLEDLAKGGLLVYLGDDATDEDAFLALAGRGVGIKVGTDDAPTAALYRLADAQAVQAFLARWHQTLEGIKGEYEKN